MKAQKRQKEERLGTAPIGSLILELAIPAIAAQLVNVLYNIVDRIYIGRIPEVGMVALTGLGVCFPIITLISAFSAFVGAGGAPLAAIQMGKGNHEKAEKILGNGALILLCFSIILTVFFMIFRRPILMAFGASEATIGYAMEYLDVYLIGTIFVQFALGLNTFISCQGKALIAMLSVLIGAIINIVLDPIFIFVFDMGVKGAALATIISQMFSAIWVVGYLLSKHSGLRLKAKNLVPDMRIVGAIAALGVSPFVMQATESLVVVTFNSGLKQFGGDLYVGSMTILSSVMQIVVIPIQGLTQGTQPIISYNYGAKQFDRVKQAFKRVLIICFSATTVCCLLTVFFPTVFARLFTDEADAIALVGKVLPIYMGGIWLFGVQMACQSSFMAMGQAKISLFLALLRKVILLVPLALILPRVFNNVMGIYWAEPIADIIAALTTGTMFLFTFKKIIAKAE